MKSVIFEDIISTAGGFGWFQKRLIFFCTGLLVLPSGLHNLGIVFLAAVPDHWCQSPSADHLNLSRTDRLNLTVPREVEEGVEVFSRCRKYVRNYTGWTDAQALDAIALGPGDAAETSTCTEGWEYDKSVYRSSIVTQWNLVCDRDIMVATSTSVYYAGFMVGVVFFGCISDRFGRRIAVRMSVVLMAVASMCVPFSPNFIVFLCLRFAVAFASLGGFTCAFVAIMEMVSPEWRLLASMVHGYYWAVSCILVPTFAYFLRDWVHLQIVASVLGTICSLPMFLMPESPRWLYSQDRHEEADEVVRRIAKINGRTLPEDFKVEIKKDDKRAYVWDLFRTPGLRWRTLIIFFGWFVVSMTYYGLTLNTSNLGGDDHVNGFISGALELPASIFNHLTLIWLGRKTVLSANFVLSGLSLLGILGVLGHSIATISLAMAGKFFCSTAFGTIYIFSAEQFPTVVRNVGVGASSFWARIGAIIAPHIGRMMNISRIIPYVTFGALSIVAGLLSLFLPETKGRELAETIKDGMEFDRKVKYAKDNPAFEKTSL